VATAPYTFDAYRPGSLAGVVALHMAYYGDAWGFGLEFETKVALEMAEFLRRMEPGRDLFLTAWDREGRLAGSVTIDVSGGGAQGAHLRWFIVSPQTRGKGLGKDLMDRAMEFCDRQHLVQIWLTTFAGLDAARGLYERHGFRLASENQQDQWRGGVREQLFLRGRKA
jgi:ribosomal protein S18 acetylase RimI-like enzyme